MKVDAGSQLSDSRRTFPSGSSCSNAFQQETNDQATAEMCDTSNRLAGPSLANQPQDGWSRNWPDWLLTWRIPRVT